MDGERECAANDDDDDDDDVHKSRRLNGYDAEISKPSSPLLSSELLLLCDDDDLFFPRSYPV